MIVACNCFCCQRNKVTQFDIGISGDSLPIQTKNQQKIIDLQDEIIGRLERINKSEYQALLKQVKEFRDSSDFKGLCRFYGERIISFEKELAPLRAKLKGLRE